jgi:chromosomal replication initiator protein
VGYINQTGLKQARRLFLGHIQSHPRFVGYHMEELKAGNTQKPLCRAVPIAEVQNRVARAFEVSRAEILSRSRRQPIAHARQIAMYLCRDLAKQAEGGRGHGWASFPRIGMASARDHSSVIHAYQVVERKRRSDRQFARLIDELTDKLRSWSGSAR